MAQSIRFSSGTDSVLASAARLDSLNEEFESIFTSFYSTVESDLMTNWKGEDSDAFRQKTADMRSNFESMRDIITEYANFLRSAARAHEARQQESRNAANQVLF